MTEQEINDGNKLIAEFYKDCKYVKREGYTSLKCVGERWDFPHSVETNMLYNNYPIADGYLRGLINPDFTLLKFHSSWDWIMCVIEKIQIDLHKGEDERGLEYTIKYLLDGIYRKDNSFRDGTPLTLENLWVKCVEYSKLFTL